MEQKENEMNDEDPDGNNSLTPSPFASRTNFGSRSVGFTLESMDNMESNDHSDSDRGQYLSPHMISPGTFSTFDITKSHQMASQRAAKRRAKIEKLKQKTKSIAK